MSDLARARVDGGRLWGALMEMGEIGGTPKGGCTRLTLTDVDKRGRELFRAWSEQAGLTVKVDAMGNMFARRRGVEDGLAPVLIGSHLDTQPAGGKFDGVLGVLGALEVIRALNDLNLKTRRPIEVVSWTNEEGSRYAPAMIGSGVFAGVYAQEYAYSLIDGDGKKFGDELARIGFKGPEPVGGRPIHALFELHIEQGPALEAEGYDIGVVTHAQGQSWFDVRLSGFASHAGSTPLPQRRDALLGAARVVELVRAIGLSKPPLGVATCGMIRVAPNSRNIIPGEALVTCDLRHPDGAALSEMDAALREGVKAIAEKSGLAYALEPVFYYAPVAFDPTNVAAARRAAERLGYKHRDIVSGAGHDSCHIAQIAPTSMIFVPCVGGVSHNESDAITPEWAAAGANVLLHAALEKAEAVA